MQRWTFSVRMYRTCDERRRESAIVVDSDTTQAAVCFFVVKGVAECASSRGDGMAFTAYGCDRGRSSHTCVRCDGIILPLTSSLRYHPNFSFCRPGKPLATVFDSTSKGLESALPGYGANLAVIIVRILYTLQSSLHIRIPIFEVTEGL